MICPQLIVARVAYAVRGIIEPSVKGRSTHSFLLWIMLCWKNFQSPRIQKVISELHLPCAKCHKCGEDDPFFHMIFNEQLAFTLY